MNSKVNSGCCVNDLFWTCFKARTAFFFQDVRSPTKRKPPMDSSISLTPLKILRTDPPAAEDSPRKSSLRLKPLIQTDEVRLSPRKRSQPPSTPTKGPTRPETPRRGSKVRQTKEDGAHVNQKEDVSRKELQRDADMQPTIKSCSKTQVMWIELLHTLMLFFYAIKDLDVLFGAPRSVAVNRY